MYITIDEYDRIIKNVRKSTIKKHVQRKYTKNTLTTIVLDVFILGDAVTFYYAEIVKGIKYTHLFVRTISREKFNSYIKDFSNNKITEDVLLST